MNRNVTQSATRTAKAQARAEAADLPRQVRELERIVGALAHLAGADAVVRAEADLTAAHHAKIVSGLLASSTLTTAEVVSPTTAIVKGSTDGSVVFVQARSFRPDFAAAIMGTLRGATVPEAEGRPAFTVLEIFDAVTPLAQVVAGIPVGTTVEGSA